MRLFSLLFVLFLSACATFALPERNKALVVLSETQDNKWLASVTFSAPVEHLLFTSSQAEFRAKTWKLLSPGRLESHSGVDAVHFDTPTMRAQFEIDPAIGSLRMMRFPFYKFSDGGTIILTEQFYMVPARSEEEVKNLGGDLKKWRGALLDHTLKIATSKPAYLNGDPIQYDTLTDYDHLSQFIYVGKTSLQDYANFRGAIDPNLPEWISEDVDKNIGLIIAELEKLFGAALPSKPKLFLMGDPKSDKYFGYSGVAYPNRILTLKIEGSAIASPSDLVFDGIMDFYAHELSHLFQRINDISRDTENTAWISEGSASLMGYRALLGTGLVGDDYFASELKKAYESCYSVLSGSIAYGRSSVQSRYYDCGTLIALITEASLPDDDIFSFWSKLSERATSKKDIYGSDMYFALMADLGAPAPIIEELKTLIDTHVESSNFLNGPDLTETLLKLLEQTDLNPKESSPGRLVGLNWK